MALTDEIHEKAMEEMDGMMSESESHHSTYPPLVTSAAMDD